jgi:hypothetical protein
LDVLVHPTLVAGHDPGGRSPGLFALGTSDGLGITFFFGALSQLPHLEPMDSPLDLPLVGVLWLGGILRRLGLSSAFPCKVTAVSYFVKWRM